MKKLMEIGGITEKVRIMLKDLESDSWLKLDSWKKREKSEEKLEIDQFF